MARATTGYFALWSNVFHKLPAAPLNYVDIYEAFKQPQHLYILFTLYLDKN
jgi:hypothetical protein